MKLTISRESCSNRSFTPIQRAARPRTWVAFSAILIILLLSHPGCVGAGGVAIALAGDSEVPAAAEPALRSSLLELAQEAKDRFRVRMNPSAPNLTLLDIVAVEQKTRAGRTYALQSFESAIDALLAQADQSPEAAHAVKAALWRFVATGKTAPIDAIFSDIIEREMGGGRVGARPAGAIRNSVALAELPAALARMIKLPGQSLAHLARRRCRPTDARPSSIRTSRGPGSRSPGWARQAVRMSPKWNRQSTRAKRPPGQLATMTPSSPRCCSSAASTGTGTAERG
jgi:hypothetical protein